MHTLTVLCESEFNQNPLKGVFPPEDSAFFNCEHNINMWNLIIYDTINCEGVIIYLICHDNEIYFKSANLGGIELNKSID